MSPSTDLPFFAFSFFPCVCASRYAFSIFIDCFLYLSVFWQFLHVLIAWWETCWLSLQDARAVRVSSLPASQQCFVRCRLPVRCGCLLNEPALLRFPVSVQRFSVVFFFRPSVLNSQHSSVFQCVGVRVCMRDACYLIECLAHDGVRACVYLCICGCHCVCVHVIFSVP